MAEQHPAVGVLPARHRNRESARRCRPARARPGSRRTRRAAGHRRRSGRRGRARAECRRRPARAGGRRRAHGRRSRCRSACRSWRSHARSGIERRADARRDRRGALARAIDPHVDEAPRRPPARRRRGGKCRSRRSPTSSRAGRPEARHRWFRETTAASRTGSSFRRHSRSPDRWRCRGRRSGSRCSFTAVSKYE